MDGPIFMYCSDEPRKILAGSTALTVGLAVRVTRGKNSASASPISAMAAWRLASA